MGITKKSIDPGNAIRPLVPFKNARSALSAFLAELSFSAEDTILLPAYIGWSKNEGSGVFDPVRAAGTRFEFYRVDRQLEIDLADLRARLTAHRPRLVVFIHYFGWPDRHLAEAIALARQVGALVLEDEAHALYSDMITGICGRDGDVAIVSLHKMLPFNEGGWLIINQSLDQAISNQLQQTAAQVQLERSPFNYDWLRVSLVRRTNAQKLLQLLQPLRGKIDPLHADVPEGVIPQSLPVIVRAGSRDECYFYLNELGFGAVSLYHTLIGEIAPDEFPDSHWLARHVFNLPVHQDILPGQLEAMVTHLGHWAS
jgi:dTDP-4-amino-4,6-dideoxygalactose transaminase